MNIITTPMCEDILIIAGLTDYNVVKPDNICNADVAILLSETKSTIPKISIKLNTYSQIYDSIMLLKEEFNTTPKKNDITALKKLINDNNKKRSNRKNIKVKVYSDFLKDTVLDMGYVICDDDYDYMVMPDYMDIEFKDNKNTIIVPSHKKVSKNVIQRIQNRYELLEKRLCMKQ